MLITCTCCKDPFNEADASGSKDLGGPVCPQCNLNLKAAGGWLDHTNAVLGGFGLKGVTQQFNHRIKP